MPKRKRMSHVRENASTDSSGSIESPLSWIPLELLLGVLAYSHALELVRFRRVCKTWKSIIDAWKERFTTIDLRHDSVDGLMFALPVSKKLERIGMPYTLHANHVISELTTVAMMNLTIPESVRSIDYVAIVHDHLAGSSLIKLLERDGSKIVRLTLIVYEYAEVPELFDAILSNLREDAKIYVTCDAMSVNETELIACVSSTIFMSDKRVVGLNVYNSLTLDVHALNLLCNAKDREIECIGLQIGMPWRSSKDRVLEQKIISCTRVNTIHRLDLTIGNMWDVTNDRLSDVMKALVNLKHLAIHATGLREKARYLNEILAVAYDRIEELELQIEPEDMTLFLSFFPSSLSRVRRLRIDAERLHIISIANRIPALRHMVITGGISYSDMIKIWTELPKLSILIAISSVLDAQHTKDTSTVTQRIFPMDDGTSMIQFHRPES